MSFKAFEVWKKNVQYVRCCLRFRDVSWDVPVVPRMMSGHNRYWMYLIYSPECFSTLTQILFLCLFCSCFIAFWSMGRKSTPIWQGRPICNGYKKNTFIQQVRRNPRTLFSTWELNFVQPQKMSLECWKLWVLFAISCQYIVIFTDLRICNFKYKLEIKTQNYKI